MGSHVSLYLAVIALFQMTNQIPTDMNSGEILKKIIPEVIAAMEGNQKNFDSIHTLQAVITRKSTHDYGDKGSRQLMERQKNLV